ncbi:TadE/TadG family type IV pilus assembly protein [Gimesia algae]|uniref:TadE-like protein n=1 Tax=Gimesia algae TaxID=2527971 RepID=A0A517V7S7_9PLAN|nr:TadE/TadG family type IV pilus assembly protein [Gimesia algae]QDT89054.1 TadE-like protein [Gimesia algae]
MQVMQKQRRQSVISKQSRRGVAAVEFALIAPVFLALLLGMVAVRKAVHTTTVMDAALAQAGRLASMDAGLKLPAGKTLNDKIILDVRNFLRASGIENDETNLVVTITHAEDENGVPLDPMPNPPSTGTDFDLSNSDNRNRLFRIGIEIPEGASNSTLSDIMNLEGSMAKPMSGDPVWDLILNNGTTKIVN